MIQAAAEKNQACAAVWAQVGESCIWLAPTMESPGRSKKGKAIPGKRQRTAPFDEPGGILDMPVDFPDFILFSLSSRTVVCYDSAMASYRNNNRKRETQEEALTRRLGVARRSAMYVVKTLLFIIMGCILCIMAFLTAMNASNLYIITSEGMALRADCIIADGAQNDLEEYFTLTFLDQDDALSSTTYDPYEITSYNYDLSIQSVSVLPWSVVATITATERVSIKGTVNPDQLSEGQNSEDFPLPPWIPVKYKIHLINQNGRWYINELETMETNPEEKVQGTPDPNQSPIPAATPSPTPTATPVGSPDAIITGNS